MKTTSILAKYFRDPTRETLAEFAAELRTLSPEERLELAKLAAIEMGVEVEV